MPTAIRPSVATSISHRCAMANRMILSSNLIPPGRWSVVMGSPRFLDIGLDQIALLAHDLIALVQTRQAFHPFAVPLPQLNWPHPVVLAHAHDHHATVPEGL